MTLAERLRIALAEERAAGSELMRGDHWQFEPGYVGRPAAVLVAVTDRPDPGVILTQRTETLRNHAGQIAFPGGSIDPEDDGPVAAALREAEEEIGLARSGVHVIGTTEIYRTVTGFDVTPVVGVVAPDLPFAPEEREVAEVFEVPLSFLLDHANHVRTQAEWQGTQRHYYEIAWGDRRIWGATAAILVNLSRRLQWTA